MKIFFLILATHAPVWCEASITINKAHRAETQLTQIVPGLPPATPIDSSHLITISDAEKIPGQPARLTDSASKIKDDVWTYSCAYTANLKDQKTGKTGVIYFMFEQYKQAASAKKVYASIKKSNEKHEGVRVLRNLGDEAYFHSDGENFYFVLVRKGEKVIRRKVNKTTSTTSLDDFNLIAKNITAAL